MIITCEACQKRYLIEKGDIGPQGRQVRCISCGHSWEQRPIEETFAALPPKPATFDPGYTAEIRRTCKFSWVIGATGGIIVIALAFYMARGPIVAGWPKAEKIFTIFKIPLLHRYEGLTLENVVPLQIDHVKDAAYALKGEIVNEANEIRSVPTLEVIAQGDCKYAGLISRLQSVMRRAKEKLLNRPSTSDSFCILETWNYRLAETRIFPGERITFETPPRPVIAGATEILIEF